MICRICRAGDCLSNANADAPDEAEESAGEADEQALQGEASGVSMYKQIQASSAASLQRQKAARMQASTCSLQSPGAFCELHASGNQPFVGLCFAVGGILATCFLAASLRQPTTSMQALVQQDSWPVTLLETMLCAPSCTFCVLDNLQGI